MIPYGRQSIDDDDIAAVVAVLKGDSLTRGPAVDEFEHRLAERVEARHAVAYANGTAALHGAIVAAQVAPGAKVATSASDSGGGETTSGRTTLVSSGPRVGPTPADGGGVMPAPRHATRRERHSREWRVRALMLSQRRESIAVSKRPTLSPVAPAPISPIRQIFPWAGPRPPPTSMPWSSKRALRSGPSSRPPGSLAEVSCGSRWPSAANNTKPRA